ncbi:hypothetical protein Adu01nite_41650 [Paractinoplanes durhamensis]|uniref:Uncharacterized protein n=1 Tax=Paractinoplanes durhamensis TaxID=113563 RepID=A0ABQ3YZ64_9ACTN|nr:hypothetical protein Adu01nite_41650 [Actinoplanes durhamensis]
MVLANGWKLISFRMLCGRRHRLPRQAAQPAHVSSGSWQIRTLTLFLGSRPRTRRPQVDVGYPTPLHIDPD